MSRHDLPNDANPLAKAIGQRLLFVMEERGVLPDSAARQCGLSPVRFEYLLQGAQVPDEREAQRIAGWLYEGKDYTKDPMPDTPAKARKGKGFKTVSAQLPRKMEERAQRTAKRLGLSMSGLIQLSLGRLIDNEPVIHTFRLAAERLQQSRMGDYLDAAPSIKLILDGDIELAVAMGAYLAPAKEEPKPMQTHPVLGVTVSEDEWEILD